MERILERFRNGDHLALAVSGGSDSIAMLHLALAERPPSQLVVLTVDHGLRPESRAEVQQVAQWCDALGVEHHILTWDGEKPRTGIQAKARTARYDVMTRWCRENRILTLLTAHTMDDQAETVVMRLARTQSNKSLAGIWPETKWNGVRVVRPLLQQRRAALRDMLRSKNIFWLDDPGNENEAFERVRVRKAMADADVVALAAKADAARHEVLALQTQARDFLSARSDISPLGLVTLRRDHLRDVSPDLAAEVLSMAVALAGGGHVVDPDQVSHLTQRVLGSTLFRMTLGGAVIAVRKAAVLVGREAGRIGDGLARVDETGGIHWDGRFLISAPPGSQVAPIGARCPRPQKKVPAFVLAALPEVTLPDGRRILPHFEVIPGVTVTFGEGFWA